MPKVMFSKRDLIASAVLIKWLAVRNYQKKDFGKLLGLSEQSGYKRLKNPGTLTLDEIRALKLTPEELREIYG